MDGRTVDTQWHLGIDLASNRQSPVEASNAGRVVFTGPNGIYGNMVVVDHGLGLMSLYAHLSDIGGEGRPDGAARARRSGGAARRGSPAATTCTSRMLIHGVYTSPLEWWDDHWLKDRIAKPLVDAGITLPGITDGVSRRGRPGGPSRRLPPKRRPARARR